MDRLVDLGRAGEAIQAAWFAKEELRALLALARTDASSACGCSTGGADTGIPELHRPARTVEAWWSQIEAFIFTGISNAASEGVNRPPCAAAPSN